MADKERPIIIKKKKVVAGGHHGGAWKVAYADFVTAMMAFFLVMWLLSTMPQEKLGGLADYFKNPSAVKGDSTATVPGAMGPGGAGESPVRIFDNVSRPEADVDGGKRRDGAIDAEIDPAVMLDTEEELRKIEKRRLEDLMDDLKEAIENSEALAPFKEQLLIDITNEGLRIQIVDEQNRSMFDLGSPQLKPYTSEILKELAKYLDTVPNRLSLTGHTDVTPWRGGTKNYSNWELSADRANSARRELVRAGLGSEKIARVVGLGSNVPFIAEAPEDPRNRRISIIVMNRASDEAAKKGEFNPSAAGSAEASQGSPQVDIGEETQVFSESTQPAER